jgi:hypothetical protein
VQGHVVSHAPGSWPTPPSPARSADARAPLAPLPKGRVQGAHRHPGQAVQQLLPGRVVRGAHDELHPRKTRGPGDAGDGLQGQVEQAAGGEQDVGSAFHDSCPLEQAGERNPAPFGEGRRRGGEWLFRPGRTAAGHGPAPPYSTRQMPPTRESKARQAKPGVFCGAMRAVGTAGSGRSPAAAGTAGQAATSSSRWPGCSTRRTCRPRGSTSPAGTGESGGRPPGPGLRRVELHLVAGPHQELRGLGRRAGQPGQGEPPEHGQPVEQGQGQVVGRAGLPGKSRARQAGASGRPRPGPGPGRPRGRAGPAPGTPWPGRTRPVARPAGPGFPRRRGPGRAASRGQGRVGQGQGKAAGSRTPRPGTRRGTGAPGGRSTAPGSRSPTTARPLRRSRRGAALPAQGCGQGGLLGGERGRELVAHALPHRGPHQARPSRTAPRGPPGCGSPAPGPVPAQSARAARPRPVSGPRKMAKRTEARDSPARPSRGRSGSRPRHCRQASRSRPARAGARSQGSPAPPRPARPRPGS